MTPEALAHPLAHALWNWFVLLFGAALAGGIAWTCWAYRRSHRMAHVLPLGVSYLILVAGSVSSYWLWGRTWAWWDAGGLAAAYALGAWGLARLIGTSHGP